VIISIETLKYIYLALGNREKYPEKSIKVLVTNVTLNLFKWEDLEVVRCQIMSIAWRSIEGSPMILYFSVIGDEPFCRELN
jgi:hypothetical protein